MKQLSEHNQKIQLLNKELTCLKEQEKKREEELNRKPIDFESDIFEAVTKGKITSVVYHLSHGINVNKKYESSIHIGGWQMENTTPLHFAARYGHISVVEYLLQHGADINAKGYNLGFLFLIEHLCIMP